MRNLLKDKKLSETPFRKEVLEVFGNYSNAISMSVIEKGLKDYNRITLYRTIKIFLEKGLIHEIALSGEPSNYALCDSTCSSELHQHQHVHFKCTLCETVTCVEVAEFPSLHLPNYQIEQLEIQASGICKVCLKKE
ncbi:MAG: Fur family transcriptional regulator [Flavobacteriaceae bacterium]|nr:MAG: Fur family transcriptional regulator [Flavobacteriaceae bacterium]